MYISKNRINNSILRIKKMISISFESRIEKIMSIPFEFLISIVEIICYTKETEFTIKELSSFFDLSRKTIDKYLKILLENNFMSIKTKYAKNSNSTRKINHFYVKKEILEALLDLRKQLNFN
ncbi:MAG: HTH domain-containing protein [Candidatus Lokiarchaeota archaeon]|nr:HTH domain-containing protein [Candidatus Lokiarchaeota archaeon]